MNKPEQKGNMVLIGGVFAIFCILYSVCIISSIYLDRTKVKNELKIQLRNSQINTDEQLINMFLAEVEALNIPVKEKDITINRTGISTELRVNYEDTFTFFGVPIKKFKFSLSKKQRY